MKWTKADGTQNPDWWEIDGKRDTDLLEKVKNAGTAQTDDLDDYEIVSLPAPDTERRLTGSDHWLSFQELMQHHQ